MKRSLLIVCAAVAAVTFSGAASAKDGSREGSQAYGSSLERYQDRHGPAAMFDEIDANGDGAITRDEIQAHRAGRDPRTGIDANGDGAIDLKEFLIVAEKRFEQLDRNKDGVLTADERPEGRERRSGRR